MLGINRSSTLADPCSGVRSGVDRLGWLIYRTDMATAYAAGRWRQLNDPEFARRMPCWRHRHADGVAHPRPQHVAWNGLTLPRDHPFWRTNFPPNGWGCHCKVFAERAPAEGAPTEPPAGWDVRDAASGELPGVDEGFDYAPGANVDTALRHKVQDKLIAYPPAITRALSRATSTATSTPSTRRPSMRRRRWSRGRRNRLRCGLVSSRSSRR